MSLQYRELNDGRRMPAVGLGTFQGNYDYTVCRTVLVSLFLCDNVAWLYSLEEAIGLQSRHVEGPGVIINFGPNFTIPDVGCCQMFQFGYLPVSPSVLVTRYRHVKSRPLHVSASVSLCVLRDHS